MIVAACKEVPEVYFPDYQAVVASALLKEGGFRLGFCRQVQYGFTRSTILIRTKRCWLFGIADRKGSR